MIVAIVDYGSGNLRSAAKAFERMAGERGLDARILVTSDPDRVAAADRVVLPGVGAFADCMAGLEGLDGMPEALAHAVIDHGRPFLGICIGMQLMARRGLEFGETQGLGWIAGEVAAIEPDDPALKIPHMGWNGLILSPERHPLFAGIEDGAHVYFVHSFAMRDVAPGIIAAEADYGGPMIAAVARDNMFGAQFHPEKSQDVGLRMIGNFLDWRP